MKPDRQLTLRLAALRPNHRVGVIDLAVLAAESDYRAMLARAEVLAVDDQTLLPALHFKHELRNRSIGDSIERGANTPINRVDKADQIDIDLTLQVSHDVG